MIPNEALAKVAELVGQAQSNARAATGLVAIAYHKGDISLLPAYDHVKVAGDAAEQAAIVLRKLGVTPRRPLTEPMPRRTGSLDLSALSAMDTPDTRELLALLEQAQAVAERVDAYRGFSLPDDIALREGDSRGTDLAETISHVAQRVRGEVCGAVVGRE